MFYEENVETKVENFPVYYSRIKPSLTNVEPPLHWHEELEILHCCDGEALVICDWNHYIMHSGDILIINPGTAHELFTQKGCVRQCLLIGQLLLQKLECEYALYQCKLRDDVISHYFSLIQKEVEEKNILYESAILADVTQILIHINRKYRDNELGKETPQRKKKEIVQQIIRYIEKNYMAEVNIEKLCEITNYSKSYLMHAFNEITGSSIGKFIERRRLQHANSLLATGKFSIAECAEQSGYSSQSYFTKRYKDLFGYAPSRMKK